jgi:hypothetical protein
MASKKAQEEMVGFVLIMVIVAIIFLVFLAIWLRQDKSQNKVESTEISQFLDSLMTYTTDCARYGTNYMTVEEIITEYCKQGKKCPAGSAMNEDSCNVLNKTIKGIVESAWNFGPDSPEKGYKITLTYEPAIGAAKNLINPLGRNCTGALRGADKPLSGGISLKLDICI